MNMIITHGDLDGVISATLLMGKLLAQWDDTLVVFTQPNTVDKIEIPDCISQVFVADIAMNNRNVEMTTQFIAKMGNRLALWYDHHKGWTEEIKKDNRFVIGTTSSCAELIRGNAALIADAIAADTRTGVLSKKGQLVEQAIKANSQDDAIRQIAVKYLLGYPEMKKSLKIAAKKYAAILHKTKKVKFQIHGNLALADIRKAVSQIDITQLLLRGQQKADYAAVVTTRPQGGEGIIVATSRKDVDLINMFGLPSGATFRVTLPAERLEEIVKKLSQR